MAWYLDINPTNQNGTQYVTIPSWNITGDFKIEIDCEIYNTTTGGADGFVFSGGTSSGGFELYRDSSANTFRPSLWRNNTKNFVSASNVWPYVSGSTAVPRRITIQRIGNTVSSDFAGTAGIDITIATGDNILITTIGARQGGTFTLGMRLYRIRMYQGATLVRDYDPSASGGSGVTLTDTVSGQNGTFQNPPGGNAQLVFYSSGEITATISAGLPVPSASASITATAPAFTAEILAGLPVPVAAASITVSGASITSEINAGLPIPSAASSITVEAPVFSASISGGLPIPAASASLINAGTANTASIAAGLPTPIASASISVSAPVFSAAVSGGLPVPAASAQLTVGGINTIQVSAGLPIPAASVQAVPILPIYQAIVAAGLPVPTATAYVINGVRVITIDDDCIAALIAESRFVALPDESRFVAL